MSIIKCSKNITYDSYCNICKLMKLCSKLYKYFIFVLICKENASFVPSIYNLSSAEWNLMRFALLDNFKQRF